MQQNVWAVHINNLFFFLPSAVLTLNILYYAPPFWHQVLLTPLECEWFPLKKK